MNSAQEPTPDSSGLADGEVIAPSVSGALLPGARLRAAREARGMSVADVAEVLRFSKRQIELLEADRYDELPGATLVRGFVRGYAKLLKLDAEPLLAALTPDVPPTVLEVRPPANMGVATESVTETPGQASVPWGSILGGIVIVSALGLLYFFVQKSGLGLDSLTTLFRTDPEPVTSAPIVPTPAVAAPGTPPSVVAPVAVPVDDGKAVAQSPALGPVVPSASAEPTMPPLTPLLLEFDERSWIEVRDATQKVVFVGEYPKGTRQLIEAQAPLQLWVGRASVVRARFGERAIDLRPHTREDVARLTVE